MLKMLGMLFLGGTKCVMVFLPAKAKCVHFPLWQVTTKNTLELHI